MWRSRTPVRATIQSSLTPMLGAISSLPTTRSGTVIATDSMAAVRSRRSSRWVKASAAWGVVC